VSDSSIDSYEHHWEAAIRNRVQDAATDMV
jgi:hypothetical protein